MEPMEALAEYEHKRYVFKRCTKLDDYDCIVIMEKPENFKCNELRPGIINKKFAKFRCNGLVTVAIYDLKLKKFITKLEHTVFKKNSLIHATYEVGILTEPDKYDEDISAICTSGIHYFLSLEAALGYKNGNVHLEKDGKIDEYNDNGKIVQIILHTWLF
jgi:hypothetical protein